MGVDIASLVLAVDSTQVDKGSAALNNLAKQGEKASTATSDLTKSSSGLASGMIGTVAIVGSLATAATAAAMYLFSMTRNTINAADAMNDMHLKTGLAHKELAAYDLLARQSGSSIEGVAQGIKFLGKNLTDNRKELNDLGVTSADTGVALGQFADLIASINDPALKTTLAMKYLGRAGVELIPTLSGGSEAINEARRQTERYGDLLTKVAPQADRFNDNMAVLATNSKLLGYAIADAVLPRLNKLTDDMVKAAEKSGALAGYWAGFVNLVKQIFNPLEALGLQATISFTEVTIAFNKMMATITFGNMKSEFLAQAAKEGANLTRMYTQLAALDMSGATEAEKGAAARKKLTAAEEEAIRTAEERAKAAKKAAEEHEKNVKAADEFIKSLKKEVELYNASDAQKQQYEATTISLTLNLGKERNAFMASAQALIAKEQALRDLSAEARIHNDLMTTFFDSEDAANKKIEDGIKGLRLKVESINEETLALVLTADQLREHVILRELEKSGLEASTEAYKKMDEELRKVSSANAAAKEAKKAADEQKELWHDIERAGHDAFMHIGESGRSVFQRLQDTLKNGLLEMLYRMTMKKWLIQIEEHYTQTGASKTAGNIIESVGGGIGNWVKGLFGGTPAPSQGFGMAGDAGTILGFAGGGDTGNGSRSGGLDGQGGFLAMMHPQETVIDRTKGGGNGDISMSMPVAITINGNADAGVIRQALAETEARIYRNVPSIIRQAQLRNRTTPNL